MINLKNYLRRFWHFIWYEESLASWAVTTVLAFVLIKFVVYPGLGWILGTHYPVVAVVSGSMEHNENFDKWWTSGALCHQSRICTQEEWYRELNITKEQFRGFPFKNGFNTGDIIVLRGIKPKNINIGEVIVFKSSYKAEPIIHRVVLMMDSHFYTKGDNNKFSGDLDKNIPQENYLGKAWFRIPYLGWIKIWFVRLLDITGILRLYEKTK